jgi:hypothetical protein
MRATFNIEVHNDEVLTVKELEPGRLYITVTSFRRGGRLVHQIRRRTDDPFRSLTYFGARVSSFPSEKVHPVDELS